MGYYIDLSGITIDDYSIKLESAYLPPSRMVLKERVEERFDYLKNVGIKNVKELVQLLRKKDKFDQLSKVSCFSGDYLTILLRELNSILPKPNKIKELPGISAHVIKQLANIGITDTLKLYDRVINSGSRSELAGITGISDSEILELTKLTDLSRIKWVGVAFARMLYDLGIDTVEKASKASASKQISLHIFPIKFMASMSILYMFWL